MYNKKHAWCFCSAKRTNTSGPGHEPGGLCHEPVDVGLALVPQVDGHLDDVGHEGEARERRVEEERVEAALAFV